MTKNISSNVIDINSNLIYGAIDKVPTAAYIHIPFCRRRCYYCDFPISVVGEGSASTMVEEYIAALIKDIQLTASSDRALQTVFLVVVPLLYYLLNSCREYLKRSPFILALLKTLKSRWKSIQVLLTAIAC